ncbi:MAG: CsgG/HfaB family protein [Sulfurimonadaceae bacterium]|nr:CsgG/HfaB family protein [Sulfurimonadaceae bacterium]
MIYYAVFIFTLFLSGCATQVQIKAMEPSKVKELGAGSKISVMSFSGDKIGLSNKIEAFLASQKIDGKSYFELISRKEIDEVLKEQRLQASGLLNQNEMLSVGNISGARAFISGDVNTADVSDTRYYENRYRCLDKKCKSVSTYSVSCTAREAIVSASIKMVDVKSAEVIYTKTSSSSNRWRFCSDDIGTLVSKNVALDTLANFVVRDLVSDLTPRYRYFSVDILDSPDITYSKESKELLSLAVEFIKASRYDRAYALLVELVDSTNAKSYVPFYNLGVIKEASGEYEEAQRYYKMSDERALKPVEQINSAILRIDKLIQNNKIVQKQMR